MAYNLAEVLEQHVETVPNKKEKDLGLYVSNQLAQDYARLSPAIYEIKREIVVVPENHKEIMNRFDSDIYIPEYTRYKNIKLTNKALQSSLTVPLVAVSELGAEKKTMASEGLTTVEYELKNEPEQILSLTFGDHNGHLNSSYGKQEISIKGKWIYKGKTESVEVKVPKLPEQAYNVGAEAQLRYFQILTEAKKTKNFSGQILPQPELYIVWIPRQEDFEVKVEEMEIVHPDPALILRVDKKHDHVISLWHTETEEPLEFLVRRHSSKK